ADGSLDTSFGTDGAVQAEISAPSSASGLSALIDGMGRIVVCGRIFGRWAHGGESENAETRRAEEITARYPAVDSLLRPFVFLCHGNLQLARMPTPR
ncbi:MAG: hypothetical protein R3178_10735, partial [Rhodothermales bacterium]|nr:hypothetical protein [Rhodothermales bacterium]